MKIYEQYSRGVGWSTPLPPKGPFRQLEWIKLLSYAMRAYQEGVFNFNKAEAEKYVRDFHSPGAVITRLFTGVAVTNENEEKFGIMNKIEARSEGVWAKIKWHENGIKLLETKNNLFFTPIWILCESQDNPGFLVPARLHRIMFTTEPYYTPKSQKRKSLNKKSVTEHLMGENYPAYDSRKQFMALIHEHMERTGKDFASAWIHIKQTYPSLFDNSF